MNSILVRKIVETDKLAIDDIFKAGGRIYTFLNPVSYLLALENKELFGRFDGIFADGSLLVSAIRIVYGKVVARYSFDMTSLAPRLFEFAEANGKSIYIVASQRAQVEKAVAVFKSRYPGLVIAGYRDGYFGSDEEQAEEAGYIAQLAPDFLIVGMGALAQERFLLKVKSAGYRGIGFTCGGFIHQTSKDEIDYYPAWANKANLRFLYRMYKEKHTRKRYAKAALLFPARFIAEKFWGKN